MGFDRLCWVSVALSSVIFSLDAGAMQTMVAPPVPPREDARYSASLPEILEEDDAQIPEIDGAQASPPPAVPPRVVADGPHARDYLRRKILVQENLGGLWERLGPAEFEKREAEIYRTFKRNPYVRDLIPDAPEACSVELDVQENPRPVFGACSSSGQEEGMYVACYLDAQGNVVECAPVEDGVTANPVDPAVLAALAQALDNLSLVPASHARSDQDKDSANVL